MVKVSVIIPLFNKESYIERALRSVQNQTFNDFEVIVIDDGSTDGSVDVVESIDDDRIFLFSQENMGASIARNNGVKKSKSNFIAFLDADDEWKDGHLENLIRLKKKFPDAGAYSSSYLICNHRNKIINNKYRCIPPSPWEGILPNYFKSELEGAHPISSITVGIHKHVFLEMSGFDENAPQGEDLDLWAKIAIKYPIAFSWKVGAIYHMGAANRVCGIPQSIQYHPLVINGKRAIRNNEVPIDVLPYFKECIAKKEIQIIVRNILAGDRLTAKKMIDEVETKRFYFEKFKCRMYSHLPSYIYRFIHRWKFILRPLSIQI